MESEMTTRVYKLTRPDLTTYQGFQYVVDRCFTFPGSGPLCSAGWSHAYLSPQLAVLLNPIHGQNEPARLWAADGIVGATDCALKGGCSQITLRHEIFVPAITIEQRVGFGIRCAQAVYYEPSFQRWGETWLSGGNRVEAAEARAVKATAWAVGTARAAARAAEAAAW